MRLDDVIGVLFIAVVSAGWVTVLLYGGFLWSVAYFVCAVAVFIVGLRWAIRHEQRRGIYEA